MMKKNHKITIGLGLLGLLALLAMVIGAVIETVFDKTFGVGDGIAIIWIWGFIILPISIAMLLFQPRVILFAIAISIPLGLALYGVVNHLSIHTKWYFWLITVACIGYMASFLLRCLRDDRRAKQTR